MPRTPTWPCWTSQLSQAQPLQDDEREQVVVVDAEQPLEPLAASAAWAPLLERLGLSPA